MSDPDLLEIPSLHDAEKWLTIPTEITEVAESDWNYTDDHKVRWVCTGKWKENQQRWDISTYICMEKGNTWVTWIALGENAKIIASAFIEPGKPEESNYYDASFAARNTLYNFCMQEGMRKVAQNTTAFDSDSDDDEYSRIRSRGSWGQL